MSHFRQLYYTRTKWNNSIKAILNVNIRCIFHCFRSIALLYRIKREERASCVSELKDSGFRTQDSAAPRLAWSRARLHLLWFHSVNLAHTWWYPRFIPYIFCKDCFCDSLKVYILSVKHNVTVAKWRLIY